MTKIIPFFNYIILIIGLIYSCSDSVEPDNTDVPYVSLNINDERQFIYLRDSSTVLYKVKEHAVRSDGFPVYLFEWRRGTDSATYSYYAIKDGFFISTQIDTVRDSINYLVQNPFREQRLAKLFPAEGDTWIKIIGENPPSYFIANYFSHKNTPAADFKDVFGFIDNSITVFYAKGIGHIASTLMQDSVEILATYIKVNGKIYGEKIPPRDPILKKITTIENILEP
jgi:hypothetical protein